ncbi:MAG: hypothetical protein K2R98_02125 [Gemmataceae bacterium]|nr:hypothetical protein [Gemmataceae bacterium]
MRRVSQFLQRRATASRQWRIGATHTYTIATLILLFDKIGDADDVPLLHSLAVRLMFGQYYAGGWSYLCPPCPADKAKRLMKLLKDRADDGTREKKEPERDGLNPPALPKEVEEQIKRWARVRREAVPAPDNFQGRGDDSNTQFAVLGLWVARRYGIPIAPSLALVEARFRKSQNPDGGWGYVPSARGEMNKDTGSTPSMTCAALMVLGMSYANAVESAMRANANPADVPELAKDPAIRRGFGYLAGGIGMAMPKGPARPGFTQTGYYFLWSLERVGVGYNLRVIGNKDWYAWGATLLVASQESDGYWQHEYGPVVDTCFALLFLKRVNLVKDLSKDLKGVQSLGELTPGKSAK